MRRNRKLAVLAVVLLLVTGCGYFTSGSPSAQTLLVSGETINATGELFVNTSKLLVGPCNAKQISDNFCGNWKAFQGKFKEAWPMATGLWYAARKANDPKLQTPAEEAIALLRKELNTFVGGK